jgi:Family of unknown function (DUF6247)
VRSPVPAQRTSITLGQVATVGIVDLVSMSAPVPSEVVPPAADPQAIRACLSPALVEEFDAEWDLTLDEAKRDKNLTPIHSLLNKWRHLAYAELRDPGAHRRMMTKAEQILRTGQHPGGVPAEDVRALINRRLRR